MQYYVVVTPCGGDAVSVRVSCGSFVLVHEGELVAAMTSALEELYELTTIRPTDSCGVADFVGGAIWNEPVDGLYAEVEKRQFRTPRRRFEDLVVAPEPVDG